MRLPLHQSLNQLHIAPKLDNIGHYCNAAARHFKDLSVVRVSLPGCARNQAITLQNQPQDTNIFSAIKGLFQRNRWNFQETERNRTLTSSFTDSLYTPEVKDLNTLRDHFQDELQRSPNKYKKIRSKTI